MPLPEAVREGPGAPVVAGETGEAAGVSAAVVPPPVRRASASRTAAGRSGAQHAARATSSSRVARVGTRTPEAPAATAASMSLPMSPMTTQSSGSTPSVRAAVRTRPGAGLRQGQPSWGPCGQTAQTSNRPRSRSTRAFTRSTWAGVNRPRATPDWLLITPRGTPSRRSRDTACRAPGAGTTRAGSPL